MDNLICGEVLDFDTYGDWDEIKNYWFQNCRGTGLYTVVIIFNENSKKLLQVDYDKIYYHYKVHNYGFDCQNNNLQFVIDKIRRIEIKIEDVKKY